MFQERSRVPSAFLLWFVVWVGVTATATNDGRLQRGRLDAGMIAVVWEVQTGFWRCQDLHGHTTSSDRTSIKSSLLTLFYFIPPRSMGSPFAADYDLRAPRNMWV